MQSLDQETASQFYAGDLEALRKIVELYQDYLYRLGNRLLGDQDGAADLSQDTFLRAFERRKQYNPARPFSPWLFKIALNLGRERLRQRHRFIIDKAIIIEPQVEPEQELGLLKQEQSNLVRRALGQINSKYRESLALRFESDLSLKEIAQVLGTRLGTVKSRLSRGLLQFQKAYQVLLGGEVA